MNKSMIYGAIPEYNMFCQHFEYWVGEGKYRIHGGFVDSYTSQHTGAYNVDELYTLVHELCERWGCEDDEAGSLASDIMTTLGFEWI